MRQYHELLKALTARDVKNAAIGASAAVAGAPMDMAYLSQYAVPGRMGGIPDYADTPLTSDWIGEKMGADVGSWPYLMAALLTPVPGGKPTKAGKVVQKATKPIGDLPMDEASRMARAKEMGFDAEGYHGRAGDFDAFDLSKGGEVSRSPVGKLGVSVALDAETGSEFASRAGSEGANVMPLVYRAENTANIRLSGDESNLEIAGAVLDAWDAGHDSVKFSNYTTPDGKTGKSFMLLREPPQVRSKFAKFDPAKKDSADLLASHPATTVLSGSLAAALLSQSQEH